VPLPTVGEWAAHGPTSGLRWPQVAFAAAAALPPGDGVTYQEVPRAGKQHLVVSSRGHEITIADSGERGHLGDAQHELQGLVDRVQLLMRETGWP